MNSDEVKQTDRVRGVIDIALRSLPDLRRNAETVDPVSPGRVPALLRRAQERLDWRQLPGIRPPSSKPKNLIAGLLRWKGETARLFIERHLERITLAFLAVIVLGFAAFVYFA